MGRYKCSAPLRLAMYCIYRGFLCLAARCVQFEIHQVKIDIFSVDLEKMGKRTQLPKAVLFIQSDGAGIVAAPGDLHIFTPGA